MGDTGLGKLALQLMDAFKICEKSDKFFDEMGKIEGEKYLVTQKNVKSKRNCIILGIVSGLIFDLGVYSSFEVALIVGLVVGMGLYYFKKNKEKLESI